MPTLRRVALHPTQKRASKELVDEEETTQFHVCASCEHVNQVVELALLAVICWTCMGPWRLPPTVAFVPQAA